MNFFSILEKLKRQESSLILFSILDRIPIIVYGNNQEDINNFLIDLSDLIHFRKELVFYTDFISEEEYTDLIQNENLDYNSQRVHIRCPTNVALKALNHFDQFSSWLIGFEISEEQEKIIQFIKSVKKKVRCFLAISLFNNSISVSLNGLNYKFLDFSLENDILQKISEDTEQSVIKMKRVLSETIKTESIDEELFNVLLDFESEKEILKRNILKKEIQNFYSGSKRAFFIFSRLNLLNSININTKIGTKTLFETIDYADAPIERILTFIRREWGEDFSNLIENGKKVNALDSIQSLWG